MRYGPDPNSLFPNPDIPSICFIKNAITRPNIVVGEYTYYEDKNGAEHFQDHVTHHYEWIGDKLIIGKFCQIAAGVEFVMNGANHSLSGITTYPFYIMGHGWESGKPKMEELPIKGDTILENDIWIGQNVTILPGVHIGNGVIIGANSVVAKDIPSYHIAVGNPCHIVKKRFKEEEIKLLERIGWWNWDEEKIFRHLKILQSGDIQKIEEII